MNRVSRNRAAQAAPYASAPLSATHFFAVVCRPGRTDAVRIRLRFGDALFSLADIIRPRAGVRIDASEIHQDNTGGLMFTRSSSAEPKRLDAVNSNSNSTSNPTSNPTPNLNVP